MQFACVYWLLAAIYLFAALGSAVASGDAVSLQLATSAPSCAAYLFYDINMRSSEGDFNVKQLVSH